MTTSVQVQYRRGSAAQVAGFTGAAGEMVVDTTNNRVVVQDGVTAGGFPTAKLSEVVTSARTQVSDGNYNALTTDRTIAYITLTGARTVSLPAASSFPGGSRLLVVDESGNCSAIQTITLAAQGSDLIDGSASATVGAAYGYVAIESNTANKWTIVDQVGTTLNGLQGALTFASCGGSTVTASGSSITIGEPGGMLNRFRNGTMDVWQRGTGSIAVSTSGAYTADGWIVVPTGAGVAVTQAGGRLVTKNSLQVTGASAVTDVVIKQRIESVIAAVFCSQTVTVQAQVYNGTGGTITPTLTVKHAGAPDNWASPTTDVSAVSLQACAASAWTQLAYTFAASASSYAGLEISFDFGNNFGANTKTVQLSECDLRVTPGAAVGLNSNPPPPELRMIGAELRLCHRYYAQSYGSGASPGTGGVIGIAVTNLSSSLANAYFYETITFPTVMRTAPTVSLYSYNGNANRFTNQALSDLAANSANATSINAVNFAIYNNSGSTLSVTNGQGYIHYTASAEL